MRSVISSLLALVLLGAFPLAHDGRGSLDPGFAEWIAKQPAGGPGYGEIVRRFLEAAGRDVAAYERGMDQLERDFRTALESRGKLADGAARLAALKKFFFEEQGFRADLDLQLPENLYPDAILERRRGYCLGLTLVLLDLGERLQWPFAVASAPRHIFLRDIGTTSKDRDVHNLETTMHGASHGDKWYVDRFALGTPARRKLLQTISPRRTAAHLLNNHGFVLLAAGQLDAAARDFDAAQRVSPQLVEAAINLGVLEARRKSFAKALTAFEAALRLWPEDAELLMNRVNALISLERWSEAAAALIPLTRAHAKVDLIEKSLEAVRSHLTRRSNWDRIQQISIAFNERLARDGLLLQGLKASYFSDRRLRRRVFERVDTDIEFQWKWQAPTRSMPRDDFSVRWQGFLQVPRSAKHTLTVICSDGVRIWIDGERVLDAWVSQRNNIVDTEIPLSAGLHDIRVEYFEGSGEAGIKVFLAEENAEEFLDLSKHFWYRTSP